ncbi:MAG: HAD hydrolase family protein [Xanthomonadales bacterium]|nr:HAD hydrolase family protein [Gammaproteobacteria bacterium]MBT8050537.1 HAD hydrolase family protein [Gammaproteobacteria bacterium]MBT8056094.1 HAD hydrolase family protein [Gammaproteobacteria bacterium]NNJ78012.1 HAD hydrolase family protein [Xanthomonadales bacterium]NNL04370.1 HAD hydrolase family protein [Xanthomonadales bacterium]
MATIDTNGYDPLLVERASRIRLFAMDVDGVLTDGKLYYDGQGGEAKAFSTRDGLGLALLLRHGVELALITARESQAVARRAAELGIERVYQGSRRKLDAYNALLTDTGLEPEQVCYAGDDWVDLPVLLRVGLSVTVADGDPIVRQRVHWVTRRAGGDGAVREVCDLILAARGLDDAALDGILEQ